MAHTVIIFGPTGAVGSAAARTASALGAKVILAMRDTEKSIPGLSALDKKANAFTRVYADLTKSDTVHNAVLTTQATHAFIYLAFGSADNMKATIHALKSAGIELVVFLSSFTVRGDLAAIQPRDVIPYPHAQVEMNLLEVFGEKDFVAVRPGAFASNTLQYQKGFERGVIKMFGPDMTVDCIVPEDIGRVCGTVLAKGPQDDQRALYLYGPELLSQLETVKIIGDALGRDPKIEECDAQGAYKMFVEERGLPAPLAEYMVRQTRKVFATGEDHIFGHTIDREHLGNVEKYSGRKSTTFKEWVEQEKGLFVS
ncbi:MAG: hypothetical protein LQ337_003655 [Flavoplaca oasis]|nr:MAG: hypothetical protein LQ337_003655 [Flavoplaca oasis]